MCFSISNMSLYVMRPLEARPREAEAEGPWGRWGWEEAEKKTDPLTSVGVNARGLVTDVGPLCSARSLVPPPLHSSPALRWAGGVKLMNMEG